MKKFLAIFILSLFYTTPSNASKALCITKQGNLVTFKITWFEKDCKGYALKRKINKKLFKRISWWGSSLSSGNNYGKPLEVNSANLVGRFYRISLNHDDYKWDNFLKSVLGYSFRRYDNFRKSNTGDLIGGNYNSQLTDILIKSGKDFQNGKITEEEFNQIQLNISKVIR